MMRRLIFPLSIGIVGAAILTGLGMWQVERLRWKENILAEIEQRISGDTVVLPDNPDRVADRFLPVTVSGTFTGEGIDVLVSRKGDGAGYRVIAAFETDNGRRILIDRGFLRAGSRDAPRAQGPAAVNGNLHWPDEVNSATPAPDIARNIWFARDLPAMAQALDTEPVLVVQWGSDYPDTNVDPMPVDTTSIPNDHLSYAVTWFGLAAVWLGMTGLLVWRIARRQA